MATGVTNFPGALDTAATILSQVNDCETLLNASITNSATSLSLVDGSLFPSAGIARIENEYIKWDSKADANTLSSLTRGAYGSTAASHSSAVDVKMTVMAGYHNVLTDAIIAIETKIGTGADTPASNEVFVATGTGTSGWAQITNSHISASAAISISKLSITGTPDGTKFLRDDGSWQAAGGGGGSGTVNSGAANALAYYPSLGTTVDDATGLSYSASSPNFTVTAQNSTHVPLMIQLAASQSAGAMEVKNSGGTTLYSLTPSGGFTTGGDSTIGLTGSSTTFPRKLQLTNVGSGTAFRWEMESEGTGLANREGGKLQFFGKYGVKIVGTRNSSFAPSFETGSTSNPALHVENGATGVIPLVANAISSTSVNTIEAQTNGTRVWAVRKSQSYGTHYSQGNVSGSVTFDFDNGNFISVTVTGNITSTTLSNHQAGGRYVLKLTQDGTGGWTWTPPASMKFPGGVAGNVLTAAAGAVDVFLCDSDGTNLWCQRLADEKNP